MLKDDPLLDFRLWLVQYTVDMLMAQHQVSFDEVKEGVMRLAELRSKNRLAPIPQPEFDARLIKGHTPVCRSDE